MNLVEPMLDLVKEETERIDSLTPTKTCPPTTVCELAAVAVEGGPKEN